MCPSFPFFAFAAEVFLDRVNVFMAKVRHAQLIKKVFLSHEELDMTRLSEMKTYRTQMHISKVMPQ